MTLPGDIQHLDRRDFLRRGAMGAGLLTVPGVLAACGGAKTGTATTGHTSTTPALSLGPSSHGTPKRGGSLVVALNSGGAEETLDPGKSLVAPDYLRASALYDGLYILGDGGLEPGLAEAAEPNSDATVWTLHLRSGVRWHDGKPFTADDVLYTIGNWRKTTNYFSGVARTFIDFAGVRKRGPLTVELPLRRAIAELPSVLTVPNAYVVQNGARDFAHPIGTGAFRYRSFSPGTSSTFVRNPDYWRGAPYVDELVLNSSFTQDAARLNAVLGGSVGIAPGVPPALAKANAASSRVVLGNAPGSGFIPLTMRVNVAPFTDVRVRQAFKLLTDRERFVSDAYDEYATIGNDCPAAHLKYWASDIKPTYDPERAKSLLKAAGQADMSLNLYTTPAAPGMVESATLWAAQAAAIGLRVQVKQLPAATYFTPTSNPGYTSNQRQFSVNSWLSVASLTEFYVEALTATAPYDESGWALAGRSQQTLINDALGELDSTKAADKWHAVQEQQAKEGGYIIPSNNNNVDAYAPTVRGGNTATDGNNSFYDYHRVWLA